MSKKNRRKSLVQKESALPRYDFSVDDSKIYLIATIIMFHILPLMFKMFGETGDMIYAYSYLTTNVLFLSIAGIIYGLRKGFNFSFPFVMTFFAVLSLVFYGSFKEGEAFKWYLIFFIVYLIISYAGTALGALIKKLFGLS